MCSSADAHSGDFQLVIERSQVSQKRVASPSTGQVSAAKRDRYVRLNVHDNGIGIAAEHQERIWNVFERLHDRESYAGTGIGLAIVKRAIDRMDGSSGVISRPGDGSTFWVELPCAPGK